MEEYVLIKIVEHLYKEHKVVIRSNVQDVEHVCALNVHRIKCKYFKLLSKHINI